MKTNRLFMLFAAMIMTAAVSCNKEESDFGTGSAETSVVEFTASAEKPVILSRTSVAEDGKVTWSAGDQIAIYWQIDRTGHTDDEVYPYISEALESDGQNVKFKISNPSSDFVNAFINNISTEIGRNMYAVYPHTALSDYYKVTEGDNISTSLDFTIPASQDGSFRNASIAIAKWGSNNPTSLKFYNYCALLKLDVGEGVKTVVLRSDSVIAGKMKTTFKDENDENIPYPRISSVLDGANEITVEVSQAGPCYVAVKPTEVENLYIEFKGADGELIAGQTAGKLNFERAKIYEFPSVTAPTDKIFVKVDGTGDGSSWDNAMGLAAFETHVENAQNVASKKVYLAEGTYYVASEVSDDPSKLKDYIYGKTTASYEIYGGYPSTATGYDLTGRDVTKTIISGGARVFVMQKGNWFFDGLNFTGQVNTGSSNGSAISAIVKGEDLPESVTIRNCSFTECQAGVNDLGKGFGGALRIDAGVEVNLENCTFDTNKALSGGAIYVNGILNASNCTFDKNWATTTNGGAIYADATSVVNLTKCTFDSNIAKGSLEDTGGAGIYSLGELNLVSCDFDSNKASTNGGAILLMGNAIAKLDKTSFRLNQANGEGAVNGGGAVYMNGDAKLYLNRCFMANNKDKYNAHHIYTRSSTNCVGINNSVIRAPFTEGDGNKLKLGSLIQVKGYTVVVNTTMYCNVASGGAISLGSKTEDGCRVINDIIINNFADHNLSFYTTDYSVWAYNTIYTDSLVKEGKEGAYSFENCISGARCREGGNFPHADALWTNNGTSATYEDNRPYYYYDWDGTTDLGNISYNTLSDVKTLISGTAGVGADFLSWLESDALKVNGVEALAVDIRGEARDTDMMWPGSYQAALAVGPEASAESFNVK